MERFQRHAPLELVTYPEPPIEDRSGPALSSGGIFKLLATVAAAAFRELRRVSLSRG